MFYHPRWKRLGKRFAGCQFSWLSLWFNKKSFLIFSGALKSVSGVIFSREAHSIAPAMVCNIIKIFINKKNLRECNKKLETLQVPPKTKFTMQSTTKFFNCNCFWSVSVRVVTSVTFVSLLLHFFISSRRSWRNRVDSRPVDYVEC